MGGEEGGDDSEFSSVTSSQNSLLKRRPFAGPKPDGQILTENSPRRRTETDSDGGSSSTEVIGNRSSLPVDRTPILMVSPPTSPDSVSGDVFGTPPEEPSCSASADSGPRFRVPEKEPESAPAATPVASNPSIGAENVKISEKTPVSASAASVASVNVNVSGNQPASVAATGKVRVSETGPAADGARNDPTGDGTGIPLKDIVEAIVRNSGMADESSKYEKLTFVDILKMSGIRFPE